MYKLNAKNCVPLVKHYSRGQSTQKAQAQFFSGIHVFRTTLFPKIDIRTSASVIFEYSHGRKTVAYFRLLNPR